ncbi:MAG: LL-diaminopimelate aminotransferase [Candidatus Altiarchaeota archaeon]|nr:LL-diaminopimelate aminotransferase [Candidatus Altiarchaeota archaeon]
MDVRYSDNLAKIPPYPFAEITKKKRQKIAEGKDIVDLGIGDPDLPTPRGILDAMKTAIDDSSTHRYPMDAGRKDFRGAWSEWSKKRFGITLDPDSEVQALTGSKEGLCNIARAFVNSGDRVLVPDPAYPGYKNGGVLLSGGVPVTIPLKEENGFLPDLDSIDKATAKKARMMYVNYPNNPTAAVADKEFYKSLVDFALENNLIILSDNAYSEISYDGYKPMSFLETEGAMDVGVEFHSFSKTYNMTGWRLGVAYGNPGIIKGLSKVKENLDSGVFEAIQIAGVYALRNYRGAPAMPEYDKRMAAIVGALNEAGIPVKKPKATFYIWAKVPSGMTSVAFVNKLLDETGVVVTPGTAFGQHGEGYFRASITSSTGRIKEAARRIKELEV